MKDFIADIPLYLAKPFQAISKLNHSIAQVFIGLGYSAHIKFGTETGKKLAVVEKETRKIIEAIKQATEQAKKGNAEEKALAVTKKIKRASDGTDKLYNIIKGK